MALPRVSPAAYRRIALAALVAQAAIVVTGGAVRLTDSGLGCTAWPHCTPGSLTPELSLHPLVEFGNRVISLLVGLTTLAAVAGALRRTPRRRDLTLLSVGLVIGFLGQAVLGGLTVVFSLPAPLVMAHFLLSMVLLVDAHALYVRAAAGPPTGPATRGEVLGLARLVVAAGAVVLVLGTVVTGTGPNSGAEAVDRLPLDLEDVAQLHSDVVLFLTGVTVALAVVLSLVAAPHVARRRCRLLLGLVLAQAAVGFTQYFVGLSAARPLVAVHILGATLFWLATLSLHASLYSRAGEDAVRRLPVQQQSVRGYGEEEQREVADRGVEQLHR
jgi:cytochrome c oxidase assembly protein subunit 15